MILTPSSIIMLYNGKLGIISKTGQILLPPEYVEIRGNAIDESNDEIIDHRGYYNRKKEDGVVYHFSKSYPFDSDGDMNFIIKQSFSVQSIDPDKKRVVSSIYKFEKSHFDTIIVRNEKGDNIFDLNKGFLLGGIVEQIIPLTQTLYIIKQHNTLSLVDTLEAQVAPILTFDHAKYYGEGLLYYCVDGLWGVKLIDKTLYQSKNENRLVVEDVNILPSYLSIEPSSDMAMSFVVEKSYKDYNEETHIYSMLISYDGSVILGDDYQYTGTFEIYDQLILAQIQGKYGFVNQQDKMVIPFKYDEVNARKDGRFNVRINNRWGILNKSGYEDVYVKYSSALPEQFDKEIIVKDAESECFGLLAPDGKEEIPTIYEHLLESEDPEFYYFGYGGFEDKEHPTFFSKLIDAQWGVVSRKGKKIIDAKYMHYTMIKHRYIIAGRDGCYFPETDDSENLCNFDGVYDLYNTKGELLIGGFSRSQYDERTELFIFLFGGEWEEYSAFDDGWNNIHVTGYRFEERKGLWLILDKNLKTILRNKDGEAKQFEKGFIGTIEIKKENKEIKRIYNMPMELMAKGFSHIAINSIIINDGNPIFNKSLAVDIATGKKTKLYSKIEQVTETLFFVAEENKVGIATLEKELVMNCLFITYPVNGFYFIAREIDDSNSFLELRSLNDETMQIVAIDKMKTSELIDDTAYGRLKLECDNDGMSLENISLPIHKIFDESFICKISTNETKYFCSKFKDIYWFANDCRMEEDDYHDYDDYYSPTYDIMDAYEGDYDALWNTD